MALWRHTLANKRVIQRVAPELVHPQHALTGHFESAHGRNTQRDMGHTIKPKNPGHRFLYRVDLTGIVEQGRTGIAHDLRGKAGIKLYQLAQFAGGRLGIGRQTENAQRQRWHGRQTVKLLQLVGHFFQRQGITLIVVLPANRQVALSGIRQGPCQRGAVQLEKRVVGPAGT